MQPLAQPFLSMCCCLLMVRLSLIAQPLPIPRATEDQPAVSATDLLAADMFPDAQFVITGVLGPGANAHGPNEYLHLPTARRLTSCLAALLDAHAIR